MKLARKSGYGVFPERLNNEERAIGCCRNFWGDFGANPFSEGLIESINNEGMTCAREMLSGRRPPRKDIPCTTCEIYHAMRDRPHFISRE